jgi:Ran GTPase-activating protein (RanGAP) involved in mRNA processing and transport
MTGITLMSVVLKENETVRTINLSGNPFGNVGAEQIAELLEENETITDIDFSDCNVMDRELISMIHESLVRNRTDWLGIRLKKNDQDLVDLQLAGLYMEGEHLKAMADGLKKNHTLTTLNLGDNNIGANGAGALSKVLLRARSSTLTSLDLSDNLLNEEAVESIATMLEDGAPVPLKKLFMAGIGELRTEEDHAGCQRLAAGLSTNMLLVELDLSRNGIDDEGATAIAEGLQDGGRCGLTHLVLSENLIGEEGATALAQLVRDVHMPLHTLKLGQNAIGDAGVKALAEALKVDIQLKVLGVQQNSIKEAGGVAIGQALVYNRSLQRLYMQQNSIGDEGSVALSQTLRSKNNILKELHVQQNNLGLQGITSLNTVLEQNEELALPSVEDQQWEPLTNTLQEWLVAPGSNNAGHSD